MNKEYGEFIGVDSIHAAIITEDSENNYIAGTPEYFAPAAEIAGEPEIESKPTYYDNVPQDNYITEGVTALKIIVSGVSAEMMAKYLGKHYDAATGRVLDTGEPNPPDVALSFRFNKGKEDYRYYQYLKGKFSGGSEEATTKKNNIDIKTYTTTFTAVTTSHKWTVDGVLKQMKRIFADTTDAAFNPAGWFDQVQTPDTTLAPAALALSSSDPEDGDTGEAVGVKPALTFNNKIKSYNVTLINTVTLAAIACAFAIDATGKVLTINPNANLEAATKYAIVINKITDIYGQTLVDNIIDFTTA
jgi:phi13 family phage major tail protein